MPLREEFRRSGGWLFRWRSYLPLPVLAFVFASLGAYRYPGGSHAADRAWELGCLAVSLSGLAVRAFTLGHAAPRTSGRNTRVQVADSLNTTGAYSVVRHPLYLGNFLAWLGVALVPGLWHVAVIVALVFWVYYERIMFAEEEFLRERFGDAYVRWAERTPAFFPRLSGWTAPALPFSLRGVLKREYPGFFAVVAVFTALDAAGDLHAGRRVEVDPLRASLFATGLAAYLVLRLLRKRTRLLHVEGR